MSANVLLTLLNEFEKGDKMRDLPSVLSLFRNEFNKFIKTRVRMLDSIYLMTLKILTNCTFGLKKSRFSLILRNVITDVITFPENLLTASSLSIFLHGVISLPDETSYEKYK